MAYSCRDCSYRGTESGHAGECPACGSFNFGRRKREEDKEPPSKLRLQILVVVWTIFIGMVVWKLIQ